MSLGLADALSKLVKNKYNAAKSAGAVTFAPTELAIVPVHGIPFQLRFCPSLANKPTPKTESDSDSTPKKKFDPFEDPSPDLLIGSVPQSDPSHILVLNKFPIIQNHFILATRENKQQTHLLERDDLLRTFQCLKEWGHGSSKDNKQSRLFAFFNSGEHSGASQPHRHVQFLPVEDIAQGDAQSDWALLADTVFEDGETSIPGIEAVSNPKLPFLHYSLQLPADPSADELLQRYVSLYEASVKAVKEYMSHSNDLELHPTTDGDVPISYNLAMTTESILICPRRREGHMVKRDDGSDVDLAALNGTLLGGTLMVKNEEAWNLIRKDPSRLTDILGAVGLPPVRLSNRL